MRRNLKRKFENVSGFEGRLLGGVVGYLWPEYVRWRANGLRFMLICIRKRLEHFKSFGKTHSEKLSRKQNLVCSLFTRDFLFVGRHTLFFQVNPTLRYSFEYMIVFRDLFFTRDKTGPDVFEVRSGSMTWFIAIVCFNTYSSDRESSELPQMVFFREHQNAHFER